MAFHKSCNANLQVATFYNAKARARVMSKEKLGTALFARLLKGKELSEGWSADVQASNLS